MHNTDPRAIPAPPGKRDPRTDPKDGDAFRKKRARRAVRGRTPIAVTVHDMVSGKSDTVPIWRFRKWAKDAEVLHAAD